MQAWQATVQDDFGNIIPNPLVYVYRSDGTTLATVYNEAGSVLANPVVGNIDGFVQFYAPTGNYKVRSIGGEDWSVTLGGVYSSYGDALTADKGGIDTVQAVVDGCVYEWVRSQSGSALGGGWSPSGDVYLEHFGGSSAEVDNSPALNAALSFSNVVFLRGGKVYYFNSGIRVPRRAQILGPGAANADTTLQAGAPKLVFRGENPTQACFSPVNPAELFNHAKLQGFRCGAKEITPGCLTSGDASKCHGWIYLQRQLACPRVVSEVGSLFPPIAPG